MVGSAAEKGELANASFTTPITRRRLGALDVDQVMIWLMGSLKRMRFTAASFSITLSESTAKLPTKFFPFFLQDA